VLGIGSHVIFKLSAKAVLLHADGDRAGHPARVSEPGITTFREVRRAAKLTGLLGTEIKAAVFEKLPDVTEASEIARFGQDDQGENRPDPGYRLHPIEVRMASQ